MSVVEFLIKSYQLLKMFQELINIKNSVLVLPMAQISTDPLHYINDLHSLPQYQCHFCYTYSLDVRKCTGACQKSFCVPCLRQRYLSRTCPICLDDFTLDRIDQDTALFSCPSKSCEACLSSSKSFLQHASACKWIEEADRLQFQYRLQFKCNCGEVLCYTNEKRCHECGQNASCSKCFKCNKKYCIECRKLPCCKERCMKGHRLVKVSNNRNGIYCDICDIAIHRLRVQVCYADRDCDFDICNLCYEQLPQQIDFREADNVEKLESQEERTSEVSGAEQSESEQQESSDQQESQDSQA